MSSDTDDDDDDSDVDVDGIDEDAANLAASLENKVHSGVAFNSIITRHGLLEMNLFTRMLLFCIIFGPKVYRDFIYD